jgi:hypothetical protein
LKALLGSNSRQSAQVVGRQSPATIYSLPPTIYSLPSNITPWLTIDPNRPKVTPVGQAVGNKKALIIAPYAYEFEPDGGDESDEIKKILENSGFTVTIQRNDDPNVNNIDIRRDFMQAEPGGYGVIVFSTHGAGFRGSAPMSASQVNIPTGLFTGQTLTSQAVVDYAELLWSKDLRFLSLSNGNNGSGKIDLAVMPSFIRQHMKGIANNSIVYLGACHALNDDSLVDAFMEKGASSVFGYTNDVTSRFASPHGTAMFNALATGLNTTQIPGVGDIDLGSRSSTAQFKSKILQPVFL